MNCLRLVKNIRCAGSISVLSLAALATGCMSTGSGSETVSLAQASPSISSAVTITPLSETVSPSSTLQFSASGGTSPYYYSVMSGGGSINTDTGVYTAPNIAASVQIAAQDSVGNYAYAEITVSSSTLSLTAPSNTVDEGSTLQFSTSGGSAPYTYSLVSGSGSISSASGLYTAPPSSTGSIEIQVEDSAGDVAYDVITVESASNSSGTTVYTFSSASSNSALSGFPASNILANSKSAFFSSAEFSSWSNSNPPDVAGWFSSRQTISQINLLARMNGATPLGFPVNYEVYVTDPSNNYWIDMGNFNDQPDSSGSATVDLPEEYTTWGVLILATYLGVDNSDHYYFQLAGMTAQ